MKYLKTYEKYHEHEAGDYVVLDIELILIHDSANNSEDTIYTKYARIKEVTLDYSNPYLVIMENEIETYIGKDEIERKMTNEEIEKFEAKLTANKYNL